LETVIVGDDCLISSNVRIQDHNSHALEWEYRQNDVLDWIENKKIWNHVKQSDVVIGAKSWIGTRCIILKGVNLGEGSIVGAGSVVTHSFPPFSIIAGNPARLIRIVSE
jgi:galactoside O-acetyltransferase